MFAIGFGAKQQAEVWVTNFDAFGRGRIVDAVPEATPYLAWGVLGSHQGLEMHQVA